MENKNKERLRAIVNNKTGFYAKKHTNFDKSDKELEIINRYDSNSESDSDKNQHSDSEGENKNKKFFTKKEFELKTNKLNFTEADKRDLNSLNNERNEINFNCLEHENDFDSCAILLEDELNQVEKLQRDVSINISKPPNFMRLTQPFSKKQLSVKDNFKNLDFNKCSNNQKVKNELKTSDEQGKQLTNDKYAKLNNAVNNSNYSEKQKLYVATECSNKNLNSGNSSEKVALEQNTFIIINNNNLITFKKRI